MRPFSVPEFFVVEVVAAMRMMFLLVMVVVVAVGGTLMGRLYKKVKRDFSQWTNEFPTTSKVNPGCSV